MVKNYKKVIYGLVCFLLNVAVSIFTILNILNCDPIDNVIFFLYLVKNYVVFIFSMFNLKCT